MEITKESALDQCNRLKQWIDLNRQHFDKLDVIQFADYIIVKPKDSDLNKFQKYWKVHSKYLALHNSKSVVWK